MADQESSDAAAPKKRPAKKTAAKKAAKKAPTKRTAAKKRPAKKTAAKKGTTRSGEAKTSSAKKATAKTVAKTTTASSPGRTNKLVGSVKDTGSSAAASGRAVVAKATAASRNPVQAGKGLAGSASHRVVNLGQAVVAPSAQLLASAQARAKKLVADQAALHSLADRAVHSGSGRSGPLGEVVDEFKTLGRLVAAYSRGDYRDIPLDSLVTVIAGLVYVVTPLDLIPDSVPVAGIADDAVAVGFVIRQVHHELTAFRAWEAAQPTRG